MVIGSTLRVRGLVQGVGFRPTVWRLAHELRLLGDVRNDGEGVLIRLHGESSVIDDFCVRLRADCPPLARIDVIERSDGDAEPTADEFLIVASDSGAVRTGVVPDAATCVDCAREIDNPSNRRYRYPFTNCTHCGPRLTIVRGIPYDRQNTSMAMFPMCPSCQREYDSPADRRFHAQPNACPVCGPSVWLLRNDGSALNSDRADALALASELLDQGAILAIKGIGGFHLACDASNGNAVAELRRRKRRFDKPFALMARDLSVIERYCRVDPVSAQTLVSTAAPVVLLPVLDGGRVDDAVAPRQSSLGFMLPYSPLHHLLLGGWDRPLVMTSGNLSEEPQCISNEEADLRLQGLADYLLLHDREIVNRADDSVVRVMAGKPRLLRRARGYAPSPIVLPPGFAQAPATLALGGELKNTICLLQNNQAILSQHLGDLEDARTASEFEHTVALYRTLFQHTPCQVVVDCHPDYRSSRFGQTLAADENVPLVEVQHHFAHIASVMADNGWPIDGPQVLGVSLDGLGFGDDGTIWGGEFLLADYRAYRRVGHFSCTPMPGGTRAILEPWRNTYAQLERHLGWSTVRSEFPDLELVEYLAGKPLATLDAMLAKQINSPQSSSCGRLFDAVAGALNVSRETVSYEGQAAIELEALAASSSVDEGYPFALNLDSDPAILDSAPMWRALLRDLQQGIDKAKIAARFHLGLAVAVAELACTLARTHRAETIALSGGVMQNKLLFETLEAQIADSGLRVISHVQVPANDGGLALGQAVIAAARALGDGTTAPRRST